MLPDETNKKAMSAIVALAYFVIAFVSGVAAILWRVV